MNIILCTIYFINVTIIYILMSSDKKKKSEREQDNDNSNDNIFVYELDKKDNDSTDSKKETIHADEAEYKTEIEAKIKTEMDIRAKYQQELIEREYELRAQKDQENLEKLMEQEYKTKAEATAADRISDFHAAIGKLNGVLEKKITGGENELSEIKEWLIPLLEQEAEIFTGYYREIKLKQLKKRPTEDYKELNRYYVNTFGIIIEAKDVIQKIIKSRLTEIIRDDLSKEPKDKSLHRTLDDVFSNSLKIYKEIAEDYRIINYEENTEINNINCQEKLEEVTKEIGNYLISFLKPTDSEVKAAEGAANEKKPEENKTYDNPYHI